MGIKGERVVGLREQRGKESEGQDSHIEDRGCGDAINYDTTVGDYLGGNESGE